MEKTWSFQQPHQQAGEEKERLSPHQCVLSPRRQVVVAGLLSPVSDAYKKAGLASSASRCRLARLACATTSDWLAVDSWEASRGEWTPTRLVLDHAQARLQQITQQLDSASEAADETTETPSESLEDPRFGEVSGWCSCINCIVKPKRHGSMVVFYCFT